MNNYEKELTDRINLLEKEINKYNIIKGMNKLSELIQENGLENDPRYVEGMQLINENNCMYIELTFQLKARVWQLKDMIMQMKRNRIVNYLSRKCKMRQTF